MSVHLRFSSLYILAGGNPPSPERMARSHQVLQQVQNISGVRVQANPASPYSSFIATRTPDQDQLVSQALMGSQQSYFCAPRMGAEEIRDWETKQALGEALNRFSIEARSILTRREMQAR